MCIIVDASRLGVFLAEPLREDAVPIHRWLDTRGGSLVYSTGGQFANELKGKAKGKLAAYYRAGKARLVPASRFAEDEAKLKASGKLRSNDSHVLALARVSGARLLYTKDSDLITDFKDHRLISNPRGKIYSGAANADLLADNACVGPTA